MTILDFFVHKSARRLPAYSKLVLSICLFFARLTPAFSADLIDVYEAALNSDPTYQAAISTRLSQREAIPQSVAALLPNISAQANVFNNYQHTTQAAASEQLNGINNFQSQGYNISIRQSLINVNAWLGIKQANNTGKQADLTLAAAAQDLIFRVAAAYFNVLSAQDTLRLTQAEKAADSKQLNQAQKRVQVGLDALTSVYEAKAAYDKSLAMEISAENTLRNNQEALRQLTGQTYFCIKAFTKSIPLQSPQPSNIQRWVNAATRRNLKLMAARYAVTVAREKIKMQASGHLPSLSIIGNYGKTDTFNSVPSTVNKNSGALGLELDIPLFSGGDVSSKTHQAQYDFQTASANLDNTYRMLIINTRQKYNDILADISKIKAEQQMVKSAQLSLDSTEESYKAGARTIVDVLIAQQNLYDAKRHLAGEQYTYLLDTLLLKQSAGILKPKDLIQINQFTA